MIVRSLDANGDWTFGSGINNYLSGAAAVGQVVATRLLSFLGDCFFATNAGIDWFNLIGNKNQLALNLAISATILNTQSDGQNVVTGITTLNVNLNDATRAFSVSYEITTIYGTITGVVTQNLGVGPLAPPVNNLLPQFNQPLLNNVSATVINNAIFSGAVFWEVDLPYYIERRSSAGEFVQRGTLVCKFAEATTIWTLTDNVLAGNSGPTTGVTFTINASTGQVSYASDNLTGTGYVGNLIIQAGYAFAAGS